MNLITFLNLDKRIRIREPHLSKYRAKYRAARESYVDNLESNLFLQDVERIKFELDQTNLKMKDKIKYFGTISEKDETLSTDLDGPSYEFSDVGVYNSEDLVEIEPVNLDSLSKLSSQLDRLRFKIKRLEAGA